MPSILFVCTANRFRSPLAAALFRKILGEIGLVEGWQIGSAGTWAENGQPALTEVVEAAGRRGIDLSAHRSKRIDPDLLDRYDLILVMQASQREALVSEFPALEERVYLLSHVVERGSYDIPDELGSTQAVREVVDELHSLIRRGAQSICVMATYLYNSRDVIARRALALTSCPQGSGASARRA